MMIIMITIIVITDAYGNCVCIVNDSIPLTCYLA